MFRLAPALAAWALVVSLSLATSAEEPKAPHPEPRVIIDATAKRDGDARAVQAAVRRGFWGKAVGCYRPALAEDAKLVIDASFDVDVQGSTIRRATSRRRGSKRGGSARATPSAEVVRCIAKRLVGLPMPEGVRAAVRLRVRLAPGDPPGDPPAR